MIPAWAPNLHPLIIHFPIVLVIGAALVDLLDVAIGRPAWAGPAARSLYVAAAVAALAAYLTGLQAGSTVLVPGMAYPVLTAHRSWALATTAYCFVIAVLRIALRRVVKPRTFGRALLLIAGLIAVALLQQTAERGGRLVYEFGTGVIAAPGQR